MKKFVAAVFLSALVLSAAAGQTAMVNTVGFNVNTYNSYFGVKNNNDGTIENVGQYTLVASRAERRTYGNLGGTETVDTPLEFALLSYYSQPVVSSRPVKAIESLPANNRTSEIKLAAATYAELQAVRFLDANNRDRIGRYEGMLKFITDKNKVTQNEINSALRASIADTVDEEFGKISFSLAPRNSNAFYNTVLTRTAENQYILIYEDPSKPGSKTISAPTLDALSSRMLAAKDTSGRNEFDQTCVNQVRAQAALIPAVANPRELDRVKQALVSFYTTPSNNTYEELVNIYKSYLRNPYFRASYVNSVGGLNSEVATRMVR